MPRLKRQASPQFFLEIRQAADDLFCDSDCFGHRFFAANVTAMVRSFLALGQGQSSLHQGSPNAIRS